MNLGGVTVRDEKVGGGIRLDVSPFDLVFDGYRWVGTAHTFMVDLVSGKRRTLFWPKQIRDFRITTPDGNSVLIGDIPTVTDFNCMPSMPVIGTRISGELLHEFC